MISAYFDVCYCNKNRFINKQEEKRLLIKIFIVHDIVFSCVTDLADVFRKYFFVVSLEFQMNQVKNHTKGSLKKPSKFFTSIKPNLQHY